MRYRLLFFVGALFFAALWVLFAGTADVWAVGPATDNATVPETPAEDQPGDELKPPVRYVQLGPSAQSDNASPNFIPAFIGPSAENGAGVSGDQNWYLDVDINAPGWLYIYEHFPEGAEQPGRWLAYKWHLPESGVWRLGPFTPGAAEPEGQHAYRIWFYSNGNWAGGDTDPPHDKLVYWTYVKAASTEKPTGQTLPATPPESKFTDRLRTLVASPLAAVICFSALLTIAFALLGFYLYRIYAPHPRRKKPSVASALREVPTSFPATTVRAKITLPNGMEIPLDSGGRRVGREDLARALDINDLALVSRQHFEVKSQQGQFYIEDLDSTNGTSLNGMEIRGRGPVALNHGDLIELAGRIQLKLYTL